MKSLVLFLGLLLLVNCGQDTKTPAGPVQPEGADPRENDHHTHTWDGRDDQGRRVTPGLYLYQVQVEADAQSDSPQGMVGVVY